MPRYHSSLLRAWALVLVLVLALPLWADEGMWTFDNLPRAALQQKYGFAPSTAWLEHLRLATVQLNAGGSGAFVSGQGLLLTNQHMVRDAVAKISSISSGAHDYVAQGFLAAAPSEEIPLAGLEASVLVGSEDITARAGEAAQLRTACAAGGQRCDVVKLYHGAQVWLYRYQVYRDLRLVFVPEAAVANFGGDTDNFTFPRYKLDVALVRAYANGVPVASHDYLRWNAAGAAAGDLVFVAGSPGATQRLATVAQLEYERDTYGPLFVKVLRYRIAALQRYAAGGAEAARQVNARLLALENALKSREGELAALARPELMAAKQRDEAALDAQVRANPAWQQNWGGAWEAIAAAEKLAAAHTSETFYHGLDSDLAASAAGLAQYAAELARPDSARDAGYHAAELGGTRARLEAPLVVYPKMEEARLASALQLDLEGAGAGDAFVKTALGGQTPAAAAARLVGGTRLADAAYRKQLVEGGAAAIAASDDAMVVLAREQYPIKQATEGWTQANVQGPLDRAGAELAQARFASGGTGMYPDATGTLRLSFGEVRGYAAGGTAVPAMTNFFGLYGRSASFSGQAPFALPARFLAQPAGMDLATPLDFVTTADTLGGSSGSPVVNRAGEIVGVDFDHNFEALANSYVYDETAGRDIAVDTAGITLALRSLYGAGNLLRELGQPAQGLR